MSDQCAEMSNQSAEMSNQSAEMSNQSAKMSDQGACVMPNRDGDDNLEAVDSRGREVEQRPADANDNLEVVGSRGRKVKQRPTYHDSGSFSDSSREDYKLVHARIIALRHDEPSRYLGFQADDPDSWRLSSTLGDFSASQLLPIVRDPNATGVLSLPYFSPVGPMVWKGIKMALTNPTPWANERLDDQRTVVVKNLIVLYQLANAMQDCLSREDRTPGRIQAGLVWKAIQLLWNVCAEDTAPGSTAYLTYQMYNSLRETRQLEIEDRLVHMDAAAVAAEAEGDKERNGQLHLLLALVDEAKRFERAGGVEYGISGGSFPRHLSMRMSTFDALLVYNKKKLFEDMWAAAAGPKDWNSDWTKYEKIVTNHRRETSRAVRRYLDIAGISDYESDGEDGVVIPGETQETQETEGESQETPAGEASQGSKNNDTNNDDAQTSAAIASAAVALPTKDTNIPWKIHVRLDQQQPVADARPATVFLAFFGERDIGEGMELSFSDNWCAAKVWKERHILPQPRGHLRRNQHDRHVVIGGYSSSGTHLASGTTLQSHVRFVQDDKYLVDGEVAQHIDVCISVRQHLGQNILLGCSEGWLISGPTHGKPA